MGRRGPQPKSATLRILEGNPGYKADVSPRVKACVPRVPGRYGKPGRNLWKGLGKRLAEAGILTDLDTFALELLVDAELYYTALQREQAPQSLIARTR